MNNSILHCFFFVIASLSASNLTLAATPAFTKEKSFNFTANSVILETGGIQIYSNYHSLDQAKDSVLVKKIDTHNILQQSYRDLGEVLVAKEIFLIGVPITELEKSIYKQPSIQSVLFPSVNFSGCNATSCNAKQSVMGSDIKFNAFYTYLKSDSDSTYIIDQFGTDWSTAFNNTISYSVISKYNETSSLVTSYQVLILRGGTSLFKERITNEMKKQILDFHSCFKTNRCQKISADFY
jgi:hypothetical protein